MACRGELVVLGLWESDRCVGTFQLPVADAPQLMILLAEAVKAWAGADIRRFIPILAAVAVAGMGVAVVIPTLMAGDSRNAVLLSLAAATTVLGTIGAVRSRPGWLAASLLTAAAIGAIVFIVLVVGTLAGCPGDA